MTFTWRTLFSLRPLWLFYFITIFVPRHPVTSRRLRKGSTGTIDGDQGLPRQAGDKNENANYIDAAAERLAQQAVDRHPAAEGLARQASETAPSAPQSAEGAGNAPQVVEGAESAPQASDPEAAKSVPQSAEAAPSAPQSSASSQNVGQDNDVNKGGEQATIRDDSLEDSSASRSGNDPNAGPSAKMWKKTKVKRGIWEHLFAFDSTISYIFVTLCLLLLLALLIGPFAYCIYCLVKSATIAPEDAEGGSFPLPTAASDAFPSGLVQPSIGGRSEPGTMAGAYLPSEVQTSMATSQSSMVEQPSVVYFPSTQVDTTSQSFYGNVVAGNPKSAAGVVPAPGPGGPKGPSQFGVAPSLRVEAPRSEGEQTRSYTEQGEEKVQGEVETGVDLHDWVVDDATEDAYIPSKDVQTERERRPSSYRRATFSESDQDVAVGHDESPHKSYFLHPALFYHEQDEGPPQDSDQMQDSDEQVPRSAARFRGTTSKEPHDADHIH
ncbi:unnamed protein product [Amoebophrya sp. A25]|nr:unnamed protein product [Amoebophrya sp. A25]|eukprot:GSA25T00025104001.1